MTTLRQHAFACTIMCTLISLSVSPYAAQGLTSDANLTDCASLGKVPVAPQDRAAARESGIPDSSPCWDPNSAVTGRSAGLAKEYLRSILCKSGDGDNFGGAGPDGTIQHLDGKFAVCAANFLREANAQLAVCVREGYRTKEKQAEYYQRYRNGGPIACGPNFAICEHPRGTAIDVNTASDADYQKLWNMAPQFGLNFYLRGSDKVHFAPAQVRCSGVGVSTPSGASTPGGTSTQQDDTTPLPRSFYDFPGSVQMSNPFSQMQGALFTQLPALLMKSMQQMSTQPSAYYGPTQSAPIIQPTTPIPSLPVKPSTPVGPTTTPTTLGTPTTPVSTPNPGTSPNAPVYPTTVSKDKGLTGDSGDKTNPTAGPSTAPLTHSTDLDLILQIAGLDGPGSVPAGTSVSGSGLNNDPGTITTISPVPAASKSEQITIVNIQPPLASQTFVSRPTYAPTQDSFTDSVRLNAILDQLSVALKTLADKITSSPVRPAGATGIWTPLPERQYAA